MIPFRFVLEEKRSSTLAVVVHHLVSSFYVSFYEPEV